MAKEFKMPLSLDYLNTIIEYNPDTGIFIWKDCKSRPPHVNATWKGKVAGSLNKDNGYIQMRIDNKNIKAHRLAYFMHYGVEPYLIDHLNKIRHDNRICNLKNSDYMENAKNQKLASTNNSGQYGVCFIKKSKKWSSRITVNKKRIHLGEYFDFNEAVKVRKEAEIKYGFSENHGKSV